MAGERRFAGCFYCPRKGDVILADNSRSGLRRQSVHVFAVLEKNAGCVVSSDELLKVVWNGLIVSENSITQCISEIRRAIKDKERKVLKTIPKRGYLLAPDTSINVGAQRSEYFQSTLEGTELHPTLAVLAPKYIGRKDAFDISAGDIFASNVIGAVSTIPTLNVISLLTTATFNNSDESVLSIGKKLGVNYVLSGVYHSSDSDLIVNVELTEIINSRVLHSETLIQKKSTPVYEYYDWYQSLARSVLDRIVDNEIGYFKVGSFELLPLHTQLIYALTCLHSSSQRIFLYAKELLEEILRKNPNNATILAYLSQWHLIRMNRVDGLTLTIDKKFRNECFQFVEEALSLNPLHAHANAIMGSLEARLNTNVEKAMEHHNTALLSNPSHSLNHCFKASACTYLDDSSAAKDALYHSDFAIKMSPLDPQIYLFKTVAAAANHFSGNTKEARLLAEDSHKLNPNHASNLRTLIAVLVDLDDWSGAQAYCKSLLRLDPNFSVSAYRKYGPGAQSKYCNLIANNLELAGLPIN